MGYPVILCGDHAEFEAQHVNTPPKDRPDWPLPSFDARDWAEAFCKIANNLGYKDAEGKPIDEGWMISWFANALMRGHDEVMGRLGSEPAKPKRYDIATDEMVEVTQEWVDQVGALLQAFGRARQAAKRAVAIQDGIVITTHPVLQEFLDAWKPEFEQKPPT